MVPWSSLTLSAHAQQGLRYFVRPSVCLSVYLYFLTTGNEAARERYTRIQRNKRSKNNVANLAKIAAFWQRKPAPPWTTFHDPTHQLAHLRMCINYTLGHMLDWLSPWEQLSLESCVAVNATSGAASLFQNRCVLYQGMYIMHGSCCHSCVIARAAPVAYTNHVCILTRFYYRCISSVGK